MQRPYKNYEQLRSYLRHNVTRRRTIARRDDDFKRKNWRWRARWQSSGVDVIEAGFAAASPDDLEAIKRIAVEVGSTPAPGHAEPPIICSLARANKGDIDKAWEAVQHAKRPAHSYVSRHVADPHEIQTQNGCGASDRARGRDGRLRQKFL